MSNGPSDERFENLFSRLHQFKAQAVDVKKKAMLENNKIKQPPCAICGKWFGSANQHFIVGHKPELRCPKCTQLLKDGNTALVSVDNRFAFVRFPAATPEQQKTIAGQIMTITNERMDAIHKQGVNVEKPENN